MNALRPLLERVLPIGVLFLSAVSVPVMMFGPNGLARFRRLESERAAVDAELSRLSQQVRQLREQVRQIKSDPAAVERVARDELGLVRQTEVVYQFSD